MRVEKLIQQLEHAQRDLDERTRDLETACSSFPPEDLRAYKEEVKKTSVQFLRHMCDAIVTKLAKELRLEIARHVVKSDTTTVLRGFPRRLFPFADKEYTGDMSEDFAEAVAHSTAVSHSLGWRTTGLQTLPRGFMAGASFEQLISRKIPQTKFTVQRVIGQLYLRLDYSARAKYGANHIRDDLEFLQRVNLPRCKRLNLRIVVSGGLGGIRQLHKVMKRLENIIRNKSWPVSTFLRLELVFGTRRALPPFVISERPALVLQFISCVLSVPISAQIREDLETFRTILGIHQYESSRVA
ncbi:hypothetical protein B0J11DRAFT_545698 [Dendryphion nanum]|uniref:Uncharacterized protein n=1 Tax=Dendryphion nanum TaxID=256645 RepID=A0A9P9CXQ5_9PLEO|nr:hypothetical protein B0J11DRAFT_545698 [Dendryphion nanum]